MPEQVSGQRLRKLFLSFGNFVLENQGIVGGEHNVVANKKLACSTKECIMATAIDLTDDDVVLDQDGVAQAQQELQNVENELQKLEKERSKLQQKIVCSSSYFITPTG